MSSLQALTQIISSGIASIESKCAARGVKYPELDDAYSPETTEVQNQFTAETARIIAAAYQLIATLSHPDPYVLDMGLGSFVSAGLGIVEAGCVPDVLREAGPEGMHVNDIADKNSLDPLKLGRVMRFLGTKHIFTETSPDVFRNNRISSALCTCKSVTEMQQKPLEKWDGSNGVAAMTAYSGEEGLRIAAYLVENVTSPETSHSQEPYHSSVQRAFNTTLTTFPWLELPENALRMRKLQNGMRATTDYSSGEVVSKGFEWASLPESSVVVDVAGGIGNLTMALAGVHKHLRYVVQDRPAVIEAAQQCWATKMPGIVESGAVRLQASDFFDPQPITSASVFLLRYITHNWSDKYCTQILQRLRAAAQPTTKLVVLDHILDYLCRDTPAVVADVPGAAGDAEPAPLLPHADSAVGYLYGVDMLMMGMLNCQERTLGQFVELFRSAGWKLERVCRFGSPLPQQLICTPL